MWCHLRSVLLMGLFFNMNNGCSAQEPSPPVDRMPAVAGRFYPSDPKELRSTLADLFKKAEPRRTGQVAAIVSPHAGYVYSGQVAASGYNQVDPKRKFDNVFVIASSHHVSFPGASVYNQGDYVTPLGKVKVNRELADRLIRENRIFSFEPDADQTEHSLEVQIPFLQYHLENDFMLVPIVVGAQSEKASREIAQALRPWFTERNLFVFSTDFSHYPTYEDATKTDKATCDAIVSGDPETLVCLLDQYRESSVPNLATNLCGWTSVLVMMNLVTQVKELTISPVQYKNSGDSRYGDHKQVVGYWSLAVVRDPGGKGPDFGFSDADKQLLLKTARETIHGYLLDQKIPGDNPAEFPATLAVHAGAFVTLKEKGSLRGCIGRFNSDLPLYRLVREMAVASATQDNRFVPVTLPELKGLEIEISVLSPMKKIASAAEIIPGRHGIYIRKGSRSGTFLPQVATEYGWTVDEFLGRCSRDKAGIGWDGWKSAELFVYEACVFSEGEFSGHKY